MSYTVTKNGKTFNELSAEINAKTLKDMYKEVFEVFFQGSSYENIRFNLDGENFYNSFRAFKTIDGQKVYDAKPAYADIDAELVSQKAALIADLTSEFDKLQLRSDLKDRVEALSFWYDAVAEVDTYPAPNSRAELLDLIVQTEDTSYLAALESEHAVIVANKEFELGVDGKFRRQEFGRRMIALVSFLNEQNNITVQQTQTIFADQAVLQLISLLEQGALETALGAIAALNVTGLAPLDQTYKDELTNRINAFLGL